MISKIKFTGPTLLELGLKPGDHVVYDNPDHEERVGRDRVRHHALVRGKILNGEDEDDEAIFEDEAERTVVIEDRKGTARSVGTRFLRRDQHPSQSLASGSAEAEQFFLITPMATPSGLPLWDFELLPADLRQTILAEGKTEEEAAASAAAAIPDYAALYRPGTLLTGETEARWRSYLADLSLPLLVGKAGRLQRWARGYENLTGGEDR